MGDPKATWCESWRAARVKHYPLQDKFWEDLRRASPALARSTVLGWEGTPPQKRAYPSPSYRPVLAALNADFRALIEAIPERRRAGADPSAQTVDARLAELAATVEKLGTTVRLLAEAQRPTLRRQLLRALDG